MAQFHTRGQGGRIAGKIAFFPSARSLTPIHVYSTYSLAARRLGDKFSHGSNRLQGVLIPVTPTMTFLVAIHAAMLSRILCPACKWSKVPPSATTGYDNGEPSPLGTTGTDRC